MSKQIENALRMAIEALEYEEFCSNFLRVEALNACKAALEKNKGSKFLGIINLESVDPLSETERKRIIEATMEYLLEEGELGKLGMLLNRYEETIRNAEQQKPLSDDEIRDCLYGCKTQNFLQFARAIEKAHGIGND